MTALQQAAFACTFFFPSGLLFGVAFMMLWDSMRDHLEHGKVVDGGWAVPVCIVVLALILAGVGFVRLGVIASL